MVESLLNGGGMEAVAAVDCLKMSLDGPVEDYGCGDY